MRDPEATNDEIVSAIHELTTEVESIGNKLDELLSRPAIALTGIKVTAVPAKEHQVITAEWIEG